jgi:hypothetical protein
MKKKLDDEAIAALAKEAICDPRTVIRHLAGLPVRGKVKERIEVALQKRDAR